MTNITYASIVPLIGGLDIAIGKVLNQKPKYILSYSAFKENDSHLLNYYNNNIPYYNLDDGIPCINYNVDIVGSICPCAGLSQLSNKYGDSNVNNDWMIKTTKFVLEKIKPKVFFSENAPGFVGKIGKTFREEMIDIADEFGYSMSAYRTKSLLHGISQVRERSFYFFWKGNKVPIFNYYSRPRTTIEEEIKSAASINSQQEPINRKAPSVNPYYRFILEVIHNGRSHTEHSKLVEPAKSVRENDTFAYIEKMGYSYMDVAEWMKKHNFSKEYDECVYKYNKLQSGKDIMRRGVIIPKDHIGAFVGLYPKRLTHPVEDRYITFREAMTIMGMPADFELLSPRKSINHICQNVPVKTAMDMATEIKESLQGNRNWVEAKYLLQNNNSREVLEEINRNESSVMGFF